MIKRIITGILITGIAFLLLKYNDWLVMQVGSWDFADRHLGGTHTAYKMLAILGVIAGLLVITGLHSRLLTIVLAPLAR